MDGLIPVICIVLFVVGVSLLSRTRNEDERMVIDCFGLNWYDFERTGDPQRILTRKYHDQVELVRLNVLAEINKRLRENTPFPQRPNFEKAQMALTARQATWELQNNALLIISSDASPEERVIARMIPVPERIRGDMSKNFKAKKYLEKRGWLS